MLKRCTECSRQAEILGHDEPVYQAYEINQETGLCWEVCDMEREAADIEADELSWMSDEWEAELCG